jgi:hypothetical protein
VASRPASPFRERQVVEDLRSIAQLSGSVEVGTNLDLNQRSSDFGPIGNSPKASVDPELG